MVDRSGLAQALAAEECSYPRGIDAFRRVAKVVGPPALAAMVLYNVSVQLFDAPTPPGPWNYVLATLWTALFAPWLVIEARKRGARWFAKPS